MFLLENGADPKIANVFGIAPLWATVDAQWAERTWYPAPSLSEQKTDYLDLLKALLERGADPNAKLGKKPWYRTMHGDWANPAGATAFWLAAKANDVAAMKILIAGGANPNLQADDGVSPLQVAAGWGLEPQVTNFAPGQRVAALQYLIEELNADVNSRDKKGYTPLHGAALTANNEAILYLVAAGGDVTARANMVFGAEAGGEGDKDVSGYSGDTVADMANGPKAHNLVHPETVALLENLGSKNSNFCRASTCVVIAPAKSK
jgi:ankyrin repeat protein